MSPIAATIDVAYLKKKVADLKLFIEGNDKEREENERNSRGWSGNYPYLCLIHCLIDDDEIKCAFMK